VASTTNLSAWIRLANSVWMLAIPSVVLGAETTKVRVLSTSFVRIKLVDIYMEQIFLSSRFSQSSSSVLEIKHRSLSIHRLDSIFALIRDRYISRNNIGSSSTQRIRTRVRNCAQVHICVDKSRFQRIVKRAIDPI